MPAKKGMKGQVLLRPPANDVQNRRFHTARDAVTDEIRKNKEAGRGPTTWLEWFLQVCEERYRTEENQEKDEKRLGVEAQVMKDAEDAKTKDEALDDTGGLF